MNRLILKRYISFLKIASPKKLQKALNLLNDTPSANPYTLEKKSNKFDWLKNESPSLKQSEFVNHHFGTILNGLNTLTSTISSRPLASDYNIPRSQLIEIAKRTRSQTELVDVFNSVYRRGILDKDIFISILLNKHLVSQTSINSMLSTALGMGAVKEDQKKVIQSWSKSDFISLQVALTQKFFVMRKLVHVDQLVSLNFNKWLDFLLNQDRRSSQNVLNYSIERSIWRIFYLFVKDYNQIAAVLDDLPTSSLYLLFEAMPNTFFQSEDERCRQFFHKVVTSLNNSPTQHQQLFNRILMDPRIINSPELLAQLKKVSIASRLCSNDILVYKAAQEPAKEHILTVSNPLSKALLSTIKDNERQAIVSTDYQHSGASRALQRANRALLIELSKYLSSTKLSPSLQEMQDIVNSMLA